jgi:hypothetical protein
MGILGTFWEYSGNESGMRMNFIDERIRSPERMITFPTFPINNPKKVKAGAMRE